MKIDKTDYTQTLNFSDDTPNDNWQLLLEQAEEAEKKAKRKKKSKK
jgi:ATP-dependent RNA helicase RhlE